MRRAEVNATIMYAEIKGQLDPKMELVELTKTIMRLAQGWWGFYSPEEAEGPSLVCLIAYLRENNREDDAELVQREVKALQALSAAMGGIPINFEAVEFPENAVGLSKLWQEVTKEE